ncbi:MAG: hypothetical protein LBC40_04590 [Dysgonamonadaceae bacterium]|jgi:hypothetical protein|nr:hypothetical protein [Dysgonamonadaceae bacterium]
MQAYREIIEAKRLLSIMQIPDIHPTQECEVIVIPLHNKKHKRVAPLKSAMGILKEYANPALVAQEKKAWEIHLQEKYGTA